MIILSAVLFVLVLIEVISAVLGRRAPFLAALHPANALLMVGLTVLLLMQGWQLMREKRDWGGEHSIFWSHEPPQK